MQVRIPKLEGRDGIWRHPNVLDASAFSALRLYAEYLCDERSSLNPEQRVIRNGKESHHLVAFGAQRYYRKLWSLPDLKDYWYQTADTIADWTDVQLQGIHPGLKKTLQAMRRLAPFNDGREWIPYRAIFNNLAAGTELAAHVDGSGGFEFDTTKYWLYSSTIYLTMPREGGCVWDELGCYFQPEVNSVMTIQSALPREGDRPVPVCHGVTAGTEDRLGFTIRWLPVDFMYLPGDPSKMLYQTQEV